MGNCKFAEMEKKTLSWFAQFLNGQYDVRYPGRPHGSLRSFADVCGQGETTVGRWLIDENKPKIDKATDVIAKLGGDLSKALPVSMQKKSKGLPDRIYEPSSSYSTSNGIAGNSLFIQGQVSAGQVSFAGEDQREIKFESVWASSRYWGLTTGELVYVEVQGDSMAPEYASGEIVACRQPVSPEELPNGTPVIFQEGDDDGFTFKLLRRAKDGQIVGQPVNPTYDFVVFKQEEVAIRLVVLGKVQLEKSDFVHLQIKKKSSRKKESA